MLRHCLTTLLLLVGWGLQAEAAENLALGRPYTLDPEPNYSYCKGEEDVTDLTDGRRCVSDPDPERSFWVQQAAVGWAQHGDRLIEIEIDLGENCAVEAVTFGTVAGAADVTFPLAVMVFAGDDGKRYDYVCDLINEAVPQESYAHYTFRAEDLRASGRFVRLEVVRGGWYCFCDEVEVWGRRLDAPVRRARRWSDAEVSTFADSLGPTIRQKNSSLTLLGHAREALDRDGDRYTRASGLCREGLDALYEQIIARQSAEEVDYRRGVPYTALDRDICRRMGDYRAATGRGEDVVVWPASPWVPLLPFDGPSEDAGAVSTRLLQGEWGEQALNLTNMTPRALQVAVRVDRVSGPEGDVDTECLRLREAVFVEAFGFRLRADALVPIREPLLLPPGMTKQVWITVDSRGLEPGEYEAVLALDVEGGRRLRPEVAFTVTPVPMPEKPSLTALNFSYFHWPVAKRFPQSVAEDLMTHYIYGQCVPPGSMPYPKVDGEGNFTEPLDFSGLDAMIELVPDTRLWVLWPGFEWDYGKFMPVPGDARRARIFRRWVKDVLEYMDGKGYGLENVAFFWTDEPSIERMREQVLPSSRLLREVEPDALVWMDVTGDNTPESVAEMEPYIDIWCPVFRKADWDVWEGKRLWFYSTGSNKGHSPTGYYRYQLWQAVNWGCEGHAFWAYTDDTPLWDDYAGSSPSYSVVYDGEDGVVDSKRWEAYRAGIEDYEICRMLSDAIDVAQDEGRADDPEVRAASAALAEWVDRVLEALSDPQMADRAHDELLDHLVRLVEP